jgi:xanthine dehydrogenase YagR molybdenum-binding subunit
MARISMPWAITRVPLTTDVIEWEGQPVAIVLAETLEAAEEAASLVDVNIAETTPLLPGKGKLERPPEGQFFEPLETKGSVQLGLAEADVTLDESVPAHPQPQSDGTSAPSLDGEIDQPWDATR